VSLDPLNLALLGTRVSTGELVERVIFRSLSSALERKARHSEHGFHRQQDLRANMGPCSVCTGRKEGRGLSYNTGRLQSPAWAYGRLGTRCGIARWEFPSLANNLVGTKLVFHDDPRRIQGLRAKRRVSVTYRQEVQRSKDIKAVKYESPGTRCVVHGQESRLCTW
jgi:hypothetical protein